MLVSEFSLGGVGLELARCLFEASIHDLGMLGTLEKILDCELEASLVGLAKIVKYES